MTTEPHPSGLTCIHAQRGLCPECQIVYDYDPDSWQQFGDHPAGLERWRLLQEEMAASAAYWAGFIGPQEEIPF